MKRIVHLLTTLLVLCLLGPPPARAEDIDLFVSGSSVAGGDLPNVLIVLDNTANWNTQFTAEMTALASTVTGLDVDKFRLGLMLFTETGGSNSNTDGAYVRAAIRTLTASSKPKYQALISSLHKLNDKSNGGKTSLAMSEAFRYLSGQSAYAGNGKVKTDYTGNTSGGTESNAIYALTGNALTSKSATSYNRGAPEGSCGKNYIIFISNGNPSDAASDITTARGHLTGFGGDATLITAGITQSDNKGLLIDEWARFMKAHALAVTTYTIDVDRATTGQGPAWTDQLKSAARVSGGSYFDVSSASGTTGAAIADALKTIFSEIQAVNQVFASVSLPVSVNTQGNYLNQVYIGFFRPNADGLPRWMGNLKQYKMGMTGSVLNLQDADGKKAINTTSGFITECARSFWTPSTVDTYWANAGQETTCLTVANSRDSNYPDGKVVEKGGQGYMLRQDGNATSRVVKTCASGGCTSLLDFNSTNVSQSALGAASTTERDALIHWVRGRDPQDEDGDAATTTEMRRSAHGDVVHSRPVAVNYGSDAEPKVVVFYGANDGSLRAVNGNRSTHYTTTGAEWAAGQELWSFVPPEFVPKVKRLYDNNVRVSFQGSLGTTAAKPYGMDGPLTVYRGDAGTWLFAGMRRGGRSLYAFDVTTPHTPSLRWRIGCPSADSDSGCSTGMSDIGQTWAVPKVVTTRGHDGPLILMGGGYDVCEDADPWNASACGSPKGAVVYVINASSGAVLKSFTTARSVVGEIGTVVDSDGYTTMAYAADLGGNVYRIAIDDAAPSAWTSTQIAALGCSTPAACTSPRKFMHGPDVVVGNNGIHYLLIGSGDREKPLLSYTAAAGVSNKMFSLQDKPGDATWLSSESSRCNGQSLLCIASLLEVSAADSATPSEENLATRKGWMLGLRTTEQVVTTAITLHGTTTFSTHTPSAAVREAGSCMPSLGTTRVYNVKFRTSASANGTSSRSEVVAGGGLPPSPVAGTVILDDGQKVDFVIGATGDSPLEVTKRTGSASAAGRNKVRVYRYEKR